MKAIMNFLSKIPHVDKLFHFTVSMVCSFIEMSFAGSVTHTIVGATAWELCDWKHGRFEWADMLANGLGIIAGVTIHLIIKAYV